MIEYELEMVLYVVDPNLSADEITKLLGLTPSKVSLKGSRQIDPPIPKVNLWRLNSPAAAENSTIQQQWSALYSLMLPIRQKLDELPDSARTSLTVIAYARKYFPGLEFPVDVIKEISDFGVPLEVSFYDLIEEDQDEGHQK